MRTGKPSADKRRDRRNEPPVAPAAEDRRPVPTTVTTVPAFVANRLPFAVVAVAVAVRPRKQIDFLLRSNLTVFTHTPAAANFRLATSPPISPPPPEFIRRYVYTPARTRLADIGPNADVGRFPNCPRGLKK